MAVNKHINFFELQKVCDKEGCPVCRLISDRADSYMDNLLFEHVSDRTFRAQLRAAGGFCNYHSRHLASYRDGLAVAILSRDILEDRIEHFRRRRPWKPRGKCPICMERDRIEVEYLGLLVECKDSSQEARELRQAFEASDGLCAPHWARLLSLFRLPPSWLVNFHKEKFNRLMERTLQFIELSAWGRQEEFRKLSNEDQLVWKELAVALRGSVD